MKKNTQVWNAAGEWYVTTWYERKRGGKPRKGRETYAERKWITEPVFGQIKRGLGFTQFLLNGIDKMRSEWRMVCMAHNLRKLWATA